MEGVEFNENHKYAPKKDFRSSKSSKMVDWVLGTGLVETEEQANYVLVTIGVLFIITSIFFAMSSPANTPVSYNVILPNESVGSHQGL